MKRVRSIGLWVAGLCLAVYAGDAIVARARGSRGLQSLDVDTLYAVRQKDGRIEYSAGDRDTEVCSRSLFPQMGYTPCWYLRRHPTKVIKVG